MTEHHDNDEATEIENAENLRTAAKAARGMYNAYLAEGFNETQALALTRTWIHAAIGGSHA